MRPWSANEAAHRTPPGSFALRESEASAALFYLRESEASAAIVLSARKRSVSSIVLSARKRSVSGIVLSARKRSVSGIVLSARKRSVSGIVLSARKRSVSSKAPSRNGNQPHVIMMRLLFVNHPSTKKTLKSTSTLAFFTKLAIFTVL